MSALLVDLLRESSPSGGKSSLDVDRLRAAIVAELRRARIVLSEEAVSSIADVALEEAVRLSLDWLGEGDYRHVAIAG
ncbi:MAG: hypothetical protein ABI969_20380 [bacterium]